MTPRIHNFFSLVPKYKLLLGSFIFLSLYTGALYTFATTYVSPGTTLDPLGIPGSYTVTPPLTYGGAVTSGHDGEVTYIDASGNLASDALFVREAATGNFLVAQGFGPDEFANFQLNDSKQSAQMTYNNTVTGERAQVSTGGGPIQVDASYEDGVSIFGDLTIANGGNTLVWDADTNDDLGDFLVQGQNINSAGIDGTLVGHADGNTLDHAISAWGDFTGQGGETFQAITSVGSGNIEVGHTVSPANGYQIQYQDVGTNITANLTLDGNANILRFDADTTDTITYGLEQDENIAGLGVFAGSANYYQDTSSNLIAISGSGDGTALGLDPAMSFTGTINPVTNDSAFMFTVYNVASTSMLTAVDVINGDKESSAYFSKEQSAISFQDNVTGQVSALSANGGAIGFGYTLDGTTEYIAVLGDGLFTVADNTNVKDYFKIDIPNQVYKLGDIDGGGNSTLFSVDDASTQITASVDNKFIVTNLAGTFSAINANPGGHVIWLGDTDGNFNSTILTVDDASQDVTISSGGGRIFDANRGTATYKFGDIDNQNNYNRLIIDDVNKTFIPFTHNFSVYSENSSVLAFDLTTNSNPLVQFGDLNDIGNSTKLILNDSSKLVKITAGSLFEVTDSSGSNTMIEAYWELGAPRVLIGDNSGFNNQTQIEVDDGNQAITFNYNSDSYTFPIGDGSSGQVLQTDGTGQLSWVAPIGSGTLTGTAGQIGYFNSSTNVTSDINFLWDSSLLKFQVGDIGGAINGTTFRVDDDSTLIRSVMSGTTGQFNIQDPIGNGMFVIQMSGGGGVYKLGDVDGANNNTLFAVDDTAQTITATLDSGGNFAVKEVLGETAFRVTPGAGVPTIEAGDIGGAGNGTLWTLNDNTFTISSQAINSHIDIIGNTDLINLYSANNAGLQVNGTSGAVVIGDYTNALNLTKFTVNDLTSTIRAQIDGNFTVSDPAGESWLGANTSTHIAFVGDVGTGYNGTYVQVDDTTKLITLSNNSASGYTAQFTNAGDNANRYGIQIQAGANDASGTTYYLNALDGNGDQVGYIANTSGTFALTDVSDIRTKTNIADTLVNGLDTINALHIVDFNRIAHPNDPLITGFIAQEVQPVYPQMVTEGQNGYLGVIKEALVPVLVKAIQELDLKIKPLEDLMTSENTFASVLRNWLANTANGITSIFSKEVVTEQICVKDENGQTCLTRSQLDALISGGGSGSTSSGTGSTSGTTTGDSSSSGTTTDGTTSGDATGSGDTGTTTGGDPDTGGTTTTGGGDTGIPL